MYAGNNTHNLQLNKHNNSYYDAETCTVHVPSNNTTCYTCTYFLLYSVCSTVAGSFISSPHSTHPTSMTHHTCLSLCLSGDISI